MNDYYLKFEKAPALLHPGNPVCGNCLCETEYNEGWLCPSCGTMWDEDSMEYGEGKGDLYEEWGGEELSMPVCPPDVAHLISGYNLPSDRLHALKLHTS